MTGEDDAAADARRQAQYMWQRWRTRQVGLQVGDLEERTLGWPRRIAILAQQVRVNDQQASRVYRLLQTSQLESNEPLRRLTRALVRDRIRIRCRLPSVRLVSSCSTVTSDQIVVAAQRRAQRAIFTDLQSPQSDDWGDFLPVLDECCQATLIDLLSSAWIEQPVWLLPGVWSVLFERDPFLAHILAASPATLLDRQSWTELAEQVTRAVFATGLQSEVSLAQCCADWLSTLAHERQQLATRHGWIQAPPLNRPIMSITSPQQLLFGPRRSC